MPKSSKQFESRVEKLFGPIIGWDHWTLTVNAMITQVWELLHHGRLALPVEVCMSSANDEHLVTYRVESLDPQKWGRVLRSDESRWHETDIFSVTAVFASGDGNVHEYTVDPRPKRLQ